MNERKEKTIFAKRLREAMENKGIRSKDFAEKCGISPQLLSSYLNAKEGEKGKGGNPSLDTAKIIATNLGVSLDWLCGLSDAENKNTQKSDDPFHIEDIIKTLPFIISFPEICYENIDHTESIPYFSDDGTLKGLDEIEANVPAIFFGDTLFFSKYMRDLITFHQLKENETIDNFMYDTLVERTIQNKLQDYRENKKLIEKMLFALQCNFTNEYFRLKKDLSRRLSGIPF